MKKIFKLLSFAMLVFLGACQDETEVGDLSFAPNVISLTPKDDGRQSIIGGFDVKMIVVDGPSSPLAQGTLSMTDDGGNVVFDVSKDFSGTRDSIVVDGETFDSEDLGLGFYTINLTVTDTDGNETVMETTFELVPLPFVANQSEMYVAGEFNGWGSTPMELVATNTWEAKNIDLAGGKFKLKNRTDWSDTDWGDSDCDGTMVITSGGGPDTNCGYTGLVNIKFDDETLKYTITPAVTYEANLAGLFAFGNFNNFQGPPTYAFALKADHQWELAEIRLKAGDYFKLFEMTNLSGKNFGDAGFDGTAEQFGTNIVMPGGTADAFYKIVFNDQTLAYSITLVRMPYPDDLFMVGSIVGWDNNAAKKMKKLSAGVFEIYYQFGATDEFKFLPQLGSWNGDWGRDGANAGKIIQDGEQNLTVPSAGFYRVVVDFTTMSYTVTKTDWGIIGSATPTGWDSDTNMTFVSGYTWAVDITLTTGEFKFRANDDWGINFGLGASAGTLQFNSSSNFPSPGAGNYHIEMKLDPVAGYTYTVTPN